MHLINMPSCTIDGTRDLNRKFITRIIDDTHGTKRVKE